MMTNNDRHGFPAVGASFASQLVSAQLLLSRLNPGPFLNQARSVPWSGLAMVMSSSLQRLGS